MPKLRQLPTQQELHRLFDYSPVTGELYRKTAANNRPQDLGRRAGGLTRGYRHVNISGVLFKEHRVIYKWVTGVDPENKYIDHRNGIRDCNAWHNLRLCTHAENMRNSRNTRGYFWDKSRSKWVANITYNSKYINLGRYDTEAEARAAYEKASLELHGEFSAVG